MSYQILSKDGDPLVWVIRPVLLLLEPMELGTPVDIPDRDRRRLCGGKELLETIEVWTGCTGLQRFSEELTSPLEVRPFQALLDSRQPRGLNIFVRDFGSLAHIEIIHQDDVRV